MIQVIVQEFVSSSKGKDIRVFVVGGMPVVAMLRKGREGKFKAQQIYQYVRVRLGLFT
ncbi:MAG TPA: hypothetical protein C5S37_11945 [Methanophagales archaeon]|nr:hypothetical protein [Methanophagales archaeon]